MNNHMKSENIPRENPPGGAPSAVQGAPRMDDGSEVSPVEKQGTSSPEGPETSLTGEQESPSLDDPEISPAGKQGTSSLDGSGISPAGKQGASSLDGSGISPAGKQETPSLEGSGISPAGKNQLSPEEEKNRDLFEKMPIPRALAAMAVPTVISQLIVLIYNMADTFYIGRTNNPYMVAGAALILPIFNVCIAVANIAGTGGGTLIARLMGAKDPKSARRVASFSIWFSVFFALFFSVMTAVFMRQLLTFLGASPQTFDYARQYCTCVIVVGAVPTITAMTMGNLLRNVGCSRQAGLAISMGGILNIILDPLFMFVLLPPGHEILGAGIATALSNTITCTNFICLILRLHNPILHFSLREGLPVREHLASFFGVGIPAALGPFLFDLDYIFLDRLMAAHSDIALAAIGIVLKAERLPLNVGIGLCLGMVPLAAYNYSAGNLPRMQSVLRATRLTGIVIGLASIALYEFFAPNLIRIFIGDAATVALGSDFLRIRALATIMMFLSFIYVYYFQALGHGRVGLFLVVMRWLMINIPMLFLLDRLFGLYGLAWSQFVSDTIVALLSWMIYRLYSAKRIRQL